MHALLLAVGSCRQALELAPLARLLGKGPRPLRALWFGSATERAMLAELGFTTPFAAERVFAGDHDATFAAAAAFAEEQLATGPALVLTIGHDSFAHVFGAMAQRAGVPHLRLHAGQRAHGGEPSRRSLAAAVDHTGSQFAVSTSWQRHELLHEGQPPDAVHEVGSLLAEAVAALRQPSATPAAAQAPIVLAVEHRTTLAGNRAAALFAPLVAAAATRATIAIGASLAAAHTEAAAAAGVRLLHQATAREQLDRLGSAHTIVTDSLGHQELAACLGIPCVVLAGAAVLPQALADGHAALADDDQGGFAAALERQLAHGRRPAAPAPGSAAASVQALVERLLAPPNPVTTPRPPALPSDGDSSGRTLGEAEVALVATAIRRGTLNSTRGTFVSQFERAFAGWLGRKHVIACASGSAAMHAAIAALQLAPGDEVITTPITDMGALTPICYEGGVPVFADVDPRTLNVTAATIRAQLTDRTRAIVATHLFGSPCELDAIRALAAERRLPLIEDAAQAFGARWRGRRIGTFGDLAAFSLQQGKHITTGEGGLVATDDDALARRVFLFVNKAWGYGDPQPDHYFPALNYRLTELQGAVALAQLPKLDQVVDARRRVAAALRTALAGTEGLWLPDDPPHGAHSWWKFAFHVDAAVIPGGAVALGKRMQQVGIACVPRYVQKPAFECALFADFTRSPITSLPLQHNPRGRQPQPMFRREHYPGATAGLEHVVVLPINERYTDAHVRTVADAITRVAAELRRG